MIKELLQIVFRRNEDSGETSQRNKDSGETDEPTPVRERLAVAEIDAALVGERVKSLATGPWEAVPGVDMPGLAGPVWEYCDLYVFFESGKALQMTTGETGMLESFPRWTETLDVTDSSGRSCIGSAVLDLVTFDTYVLLLFSDGLCLETSLQPGGTLIELSQFEEWIADEDETISLVTGSPVDLRKYLR